MSRRKVATALIASFIAGTALAAAPLPAVVPAPASMSARAGTLALTRATALVVDPGDVSAQRVAANFSDLLSRTHGLRLQVRNDRSARSIVLRRARELGPEAYRIEVNARGATLSASSEAGFA